MITTIRLTTDSGETVFEIVADWSDPTSADEVDMGGFGPLLDLHRGAYAPQGGPADDNVFFLIAAADQVASEFSLTVDVVNPPPLEESVEGRIY